MITEYQEIDEPGPPPEVEAWLVEREKTWQSAGVLLDEFIERFQKGSFCKPYLLDQFTGLEIGPGMITTIGAPPSTGKTASAMQLVFEILGSNPGVLAYIANAESSFDAIAMRELSRRSGVGTRRMRRESLSIEEKDKVNRAYLGLRVDIEKVRWLGKQFSTEVLLDLRKQTPGLLVVDYLQKCAPPTGDPKAAIQGLLNELRTFAQMNWAVLVLSATNRASGASGNKQQAFRDSSEIEYQSDSAYVLSVDEGHENAIDQNVTFSCVKNRWDSKEDLSLIYRKFEQRFERQNDFSSDFGDFASEPSNPFGEA